MLSTWHVTLDAPVQDAQCPKLGAQRVMPSARCVMLSAQCMMGSTIFSAQRTARDTRYARQNAWCSVHVALCPLHNAQCTISGPRLVQGAWHITSMPPLRTPQRDHPPSPAEHSEHHHPTDIGGEVHLGVREHNPNPNCPSPAQLQFPRRRCGHAWAVGPGRAAAGCRGGPAGRCSAAWPGRKPAPGRLIWFD